MSRESPSTAAGRNRWRQSAHSRALARLAAKKGLAALKAAPRCGAKARSTGEPCRQVAMKNGRCRFHGGATPRGDLWHTRLFDGDDAKNYRKARTFRKRDREREAQRDAMSPAEREAHEMRRRAVRPGPAVVRRARQTQRKTDRQAQQLLARAHRRACERDAALATALAECDAQMAELQRRANLAELFE